MKFEITVGVELDKVLSPIRAKKCAVDDILPLMMLDSDPSFYHLEQFIDMVVMFLVGLDISVGKTDEVEVVLVINDRDVETT